MSHSVDIDELIRFKSMDETSLDKDGENDEMLFGPLTISEEEKLPEGSRRSGASFHSTDVLMPNNSSNIALLVDDETALEMAHFDFDKPKVSVDDFTMPSAGGNSGVPSSSSSTTSSAASVVKRVAGLELADFTLPLDSLRDRSHSFLSTGGFRDRSCSIMSSSSVFSALRSRGISLDLFPSTESMDGSMGVRPRGLSLEFSMLPTSMIDIGDYDDHDLDNQQSILDQRDLVIDGQHLTFVNDDDEDTLNLTGMSKLGDEGAVTTNDKKTVSANSSSTKLSFRTNLKGSPGEMAYGGKRPRSIFVTPQEGGTKTNTGTKGPPVNGKSGAGATSSSSSVSTITPRFRNTPAKATLPTGRKLYVYLRAGIQGSDQASKPNTGSQSKASIANGANTSGAQRLDAMKNLNGKPGPSSVGGVNRNTTNGPQGTVPRHSGSSSKGFAPTHTGGVGNVGSQVGGLPGSSGARTSVVNSNVRSGVASGTSVPGGANSSSGATTSGTNQRVSTEGHPGVSLDGHYSGIYAPIPLGKNGKSRMIGGYSLEQRRQRIIRFLEKRKNRVWMKKVKYGCRKKLADSRPRVKGRFVPRLPSSEGAESSSETTSSSVHSNSRMGSSSHSSMGSMPPYGVSGASSGTGHHHHMATSNSGTGSTMGSSGHGSGSDKHFVKSETARKSTSRTTVTPGLSPGVSSLVTGSGRSSSKSSSRPNIPALSAAAVASTTRMSAGSLMRSTSLPPPPGNSSRSTFVKSGSIGPSAPTSHMNGGSATTSIAMTNAAAAAKRQQGHMATATAASMATMQRKASTSATPTKSANSGSGPSGNSANMSKAPGSYGVQTGAHGTSANAKTFPSSSFHTPHKGQAATNTPESRTYSNTHSYKASPVPFAASSPAGAKDQQRPRGNVHSRAAGQVVRKSETPVSSTPGSTAVRKVIQRMSSNAATPSTPQRMGAQARPASGVATQSSAPHRMPGSTSGSVAPRLTGPTQGTTGHAMIKHGSSMGAGTSTGMKMVTPVRMGGSHAPHTPASSSTGVTQMSRTDSGDQAGTIRKTSTIVRKPCMSNCKTCQQRAVHVHTTKATPGKASVRKFVKSGNGVVRSVVKQGSGAVVRTVVKASPGARTTTPGTTITRTVVRSGTGSANGKPISTVRTVVTKAATPNGNGKKTTTTTTKTTTIVRRVAANPAGTTRTTTLVRKAGGSTPGSKPQQVTQLPVKKTLTSVVLKSKNSPVIRSTPGTTTYRVAQGTPSSGTRVVHNSKDATSKSSGVATQPINPPTAPPPAGTVV